MLTLKAFYLAPMLVFWPHPLNLYVKRPFCVRRLLQYITYIILCVYYLLEYPNLHVFNYIGRPYSVEFHTNPYTYVPSIVKLAVLGADLNIALLMTEYTYTPGRLPVTVSVLR